MRVLIWISSGMLEDLARAATKTEDSYELQGIVTETDEAVTAILAGDVDIVLLGQGRLRAWSQVWHSGVLVGAPPFCAMLVSTLPASTSTFLAAKEVGIVDLVDLTMDRDLMGKRMIQAYVHLGNRNVAGGGFNDEELANHRMLRDITDKTDQRILGLIAEGKFDKEIADEVFLSVQTIRNRISRILTETGTRNRTHLAMMFTSGIQHVQESNAGIDTDNLAMDDTNRVA